MFNFIENISLRIWHLGWIKCYILKRHDMSYFHNIWNNLYMQKHIWTAQ